MAAGRASEDPTPITGYHAHVYDDPATRPLAAQLREAIEQRVRGQPGRWHDAPIGPQPCSSYQVAFAPELIADHSAHVTGSMTAGS
jgi:aromatic ring-cleaving dioxygenase